MFVRRRIPELRGRKFFQQPEFGRIWYAGTADGHPSVCVAVLSSRKQTRICGFYVLMG